MLVLYFTCRCFLSHFIFHLDSHTTSRQKHTPSREKHITSWQKHNTSWQKHITSWQKHTTSWQKHITSWQKHTTSWKRGPWTKSLTWETVSMNKHICTKQWLCHNIKRKNIISFLRIEWLIIIKMWVPFTQRYIAPSLVEITSGSEEDNFLNFVEVFLLFHYNLFFLRFEVALLEENWSGPSWTNLNPLRPNMLCSTFGCN